MSKVAQLKKKAAEFELKKQFDKALALYVEILDGYERNPEEVDVALFNRVGDLMLRQGSVADAIDYYERAVDLYAEGGFFNNAIALCNKILRQTPGRASIYYKLGKISAQKGFKSDAKRNFLEYADRMQKGGRMDEAFRALKEFADLCPDQDDIRLMLAEQLSRQSRSGEAIDQLQTLYERYAESGREAEARATLERMRAIDPAATPRGGITGGMRSQQSQDLIFLDLNESSRPTMGVSAIATGPTAAIPAVGSIEQSTGDDLPRGGGTSMEFERSEPAALPPADIGRIEGLEKTGFEDVELASGRHTPAMLDLEPTSLGGLPASPTPTRPVEITPPVLDAVTDAGIALDVSAFDEEPLESPSVEPPAAGSELQFLDGTIEQDMADLSSMTVEEIDIEDWRGPRERASEPVAHSPIEGLPLMDIEVPVRPSGSLAAPPAAQPPAPIPTLDDLDLGAEEFALPGAEPSATREPTPEEIRAIASVTPGAVAPHTRAVADTIDDLRAAADLSPDDGALRRRLGEALLEAGQREEGLDELEHAMTSFEKADDLESAASVADEIVRANPGSVRLQQKRVEYAFRTNDKPRLVEAYLDLASALLHGGQVDKARAVYQRVLDLAPEEPRAAAALATFAPIEPPPSKPARDTLGAARGPAAAPVAAGGDFINLGDMLRDEPAAKSTRMVVEEHEPTGDEEADFADMLRRFKQGIAENVGEEDHQSHYDLGIAFKEMGLVDEAIAEFQKALRSPTNRVPTYEALGQCFVEKEQYRLASTVLGRALSEAGVGDDALIGVLYLLGRASEAQGRHAEALSYYQRVFVIDIQFRDVARRIADVEQLS